MVPAQDAACVEALEQARRAAIFLPFDSVDDAVYKKLRGRALLVITPRAIRAGTSEGIDLDAIGTIRRKTQAPSPAVRAETHQPISHFGRYRHIEICRFPGRHLTPGKGKIRTTLPERMNAIASQSQAVLAVARCQPPGCENVPGSFHGRLR